MAPGAILDALGLPLSAEARVARDAFRAAAPDLAAILGASVSGQELISRGFQKDVEFAAALNVSTTAPFLRDGAYQSLRPCRTPRPAPTLAVTNWEPARVTDDRMLHL